jgi:hypothetical protein
VSGEIASASSSSTRFDDDAGDVSRVLKAYCDSPVTTGKTNAADEATARDWLNGTQLRGRVPGAQDMQFEPYTAEQIEHGIVLATARLLGQEVRSGPVRSLQYFLGAVREAMVDVNCTPSYRLLPAGDSPADEEGTAKRIRRYCFLA